MDYLQRFSVMSADDVWGVETWHMNQSERDTEPGSAAKDKKSIMTNHRKKSSSNLEETNISNNICQCKLTYCSPSI